MFWQAETTCKPCGATGYVQWPPGKTSTASFTLTLIRSNSSFNTWKVKKNFEVRLWWVFSMQTRISFQKYTFAASWQGPAVRNLAIRKYSSERKERLQLRIQVTRSLCFTKMIILFSLDSFITWRYNFLVSRRTSLHSGKCDHNIIHSRTLRNIYFFGSLRIRNISHFVLSLVRFTTVLRI